MVSNDRDHHHWMVSSTRNSLVHRCTVSSRYNLLPHCPYVVVSPDRVADIDVRYVEYECHTTNKKGRITIYVKMEDKTFQAKHKNEIERTFGPRRLGRSSYCLDILLANALAGGGDSADGSSSNVGTTKVDRPTMRRNIVRRGWVGNMDDDDNDDSLFGSRS